MASIPVQFWGKDSVLQAFRQRKIEAWAICQGKQLLTAGVGEASLVAFLDMLANSSGTYTLKVYQGIAHEDDIDDQSPCNGSYNFKLLENSTGMGGTRTVQNGAGGIAGIIQQRIEQKMASKVDKWLDNLDDDEDDEEDEPKTLAGVAMEYIQSPEKLAGIIAAVQQLFGGAGRGGYPSMQPAPQYVGSLPHVQQPQPVQRVGAASMTDEEKYTRIGNAIDRLEKKDPDIVVHLEKLATICENNPALFNTLISMLKGM